MEIVPDPVSELDPPLEHTAAPEDASCDGVGNDVCDNDDDGVRYWAGDPAMEVRLIWNPLPVTKASDTNQNAKVSPVEIKGLDGYVLQSSNSMAISKEC